MNSQLLKQYMGTGGYGIERENLRVEESGFLAKTPHPFPTNPHIDKDFCENQMELITPVCSSVEEVCRCLEEIHTTAKRKLKQLPTGREYLWPFSNAPYLEAESSIPVARFQGERKEKEEYRYYLAEKYGKRLMLYSGIHFNFSLPNGFLQESKPEDISLKEWTNQVYLKLAAKVSSYSWALLYLTAASPVYDASLERDGAWGRDCFDYYASRRSGEKGYWNQFVPILDYSSIDGYVFSIQRYIKAGWLKSASELYYPVRLKPKGSNQIEHLMRYGVDHLELRLLDLNPLTELGVFSEDLEFIQYFYWFLLSLPDCKFDETKQCQAVKNHKIASHYSAGCIHIICGNKILPIREALLQLLEQMEQYFADLKLESVVQLIAQQRKKVVDPQQRYAVKVYHKYRTDYVEKGMQLLESWNG